MKPEADIEQALLDEVELSVSVVLYRNSVGWLQQTLVSLLQSVERLQRLEPGLRVGLTVVDHSLLPSYQSQVEQLISELDTDVLGYLHYQAGAENGGFARGHNRVINSVRSNYHLVLNPDVDMDQEILARGYAYLQRHQDVVLLCPRVFDQQGQQQYLCKAYPTVVVLLLRAIAPAALAGRWSHLLDAYELRELCAEDAVEVPLASGCFMLVRTTALHEIGGFCERFFLYFEDFDLSLRLKKHGRLVYLPTMNIVHHGGNAAAKGFRHIRLFVSSGVRFFQRNGWRWI